MSEQTSPSLAAFVRQRLAAPAAARGGGRTSDLSIDEELNLHAVGWEPLEVIGGLSWFAVSSVIWNWGQGAIAAANYAHREAFSRAIGRLCDEAVRVGGHGVVGVRVEREVLPRRITVSLLGTAVAPAQKSPRPPAVFASDLSARDFSLLVRAGWRPVGLAAGASFVYAPRRNVAATVRQQTQNVELTNYTEALYQAREGALDLMQQSAIQLGGEGVVEVKVQEGALPFAPHAVTFAAWGTVVAGAPTTRPDGPRLAVALDDTDVAFDAATLE